MKTWCHVLRSGILLAICVLVTGCAAHIKGLLVPIEAPVVPPYGFIYTHFKAPCSTKFKGTTVEGKKIYIDSVARYFYEPYFGTSYGWGDASVGIIAERNKMKEIEYVDYEYLNVLGIYQEVRIIPHGK